MPKRKLIEGGRATANSKRTKAKAPKKRAKAPARRRKSATAAPAVKPDALRIELVAVARINPAPYNPRKNLRSGSPEYEKLKRSIERFGYVDPLVWNERTGNLVGGHQRLKILVREHKLKEIAVSVVDLDPVAEKALNLALNKITGDWDEVGLAAVLAELQADDGPEITYTGFDDAEVAALLSKTELVEQNNVEDLKIGHSFKVIVECVDAAQQAEVVRSLTRKGIACHTRTTT